MTSHCISLFNSFASHLTVIQTIIVYTALISLLSCEITHINNFHHQIALRSLNLLGLCNTVGRHGVKFPIVVAFYLQS